MDAAGLFDRAQRFEEAGQLDDAVRGYADAVRADSQRVETYERLLRIDLHRRELDAAWCAASMLAVVGKLDVTALDFYSDYVPRRLHVRRGRLDAAAWELLRDHEEDEVLSAKLDELARKLAPPTADVAGFDPHVFTWAANAVGPDLVEGAEPEARSALDEVAHGHTLRERLFIAGREATACRAPRYALGRRSLNDLVTALGDADRREVARWIRSLARTRLRAGLLVCGEPMVARDMLIRELIDEDQLTELAAFAVSPAHHRLRALLGFAVGMDADGPDRRPRRGGPPPRAFTQEEWAAAIEATRREEIARAERMREPASPPKPRKDH